MHERPADRRPQPARSHHPASAFTLIELLVVIAVIAVLVALIIPSLASVRRSARLGVCVSNVRNQNLIVLTYANDYSDALPPLYVAWHHLQDDGSYADERWTMNRYLAWYDGHPFAQEEGSEFFTPTGVWRCPDVPLDLDYTRRSHTGIAHHVPNDWLFNNVSIDDEQSGNNSWIADIWSGWESRYGITSWRRLGIIQWPAEIITLMDNVSFYFALHGHRDARDTYSQSVQVVSGTDFQTIGSHEELARRPASFLDGHAEPLPSTADYWENEQANYAPPDGSAPVTFYAREVQRLMWFIRPGERRP